MFHLEVKFRQSLLSQKCRSDAVRHCVGRKLLSWFGVSERERAGDLIDRAREIRLVAVLSGAFVPQLSLSDAVSGFRERRAGFASVVADAWRLRRATALWNEM